MRIPLLPRVFLRLEFLRLLLSILAGKVSSERSFQANGPAGKKNRKNIDYSTKNAHLVSSLSTTHEVRLNDSVLPFRLRSPSLPSHQLSSSISPGRFNDKNLGLNSVFPVPNDLPFIVNSTTCHSPILLPSPTDHPSISSQSDSCLLLPSFQDTSGCNCHNHIGDSLNLFPSCASSTLEKTEGVSSVPQISFPYRGNATYQFTSFLGRKTEKYSKSQSVRFVSFVWLGRT